MMIIRIALLAGLSALAVGAVTEAQEAPEGQGKAVLETACVQCHGLDVITGQRRSREDWTEVVSRMVGSGAQLNDEEYELVIEYLATHLGPPAQAAPPDRPTSAPPTRSLGK